MYDFHYNRVKANYGDRAKLLMTDTDSLFYEIETNDWYEDIRDEISEFYDTSDYPDDHPANLPKMNKKIIGKMKDELKGEVVDEFCRTCVKSYAYTVCGAQREEKKKCKGIKKNIVKKKLAIEDYKNCVLNSAAKTVKQTQFRSYDHEIFTEEIVKIALSPKDDKRVILQDGIHTLPHGHWRTKHSGLHVVDINLEKLCEKGSLMSLAYNKLCGNNVISKKRRRQS